MERFNPKKLNSEDVGEQYWVKIKNGCAALENLDDNVGINRAWESIRISEFQFRCNEFCDVGTS
jgi:hypothetical protein